MLITEPVEVVLIFIDTPHGISCKEIISNKCLVNNRREQNLKGKASSPIRDLI